MDPRSAGLSAETLAAHPFAAATFPVSNRFEVAYIERSDCGDNSFSEVKGGTAIEGGLEDIERRERQLWIMLGGISLVLTLGMVLLVLPQLMEISSARPDKWYLPRLFLVLVVLIAFVNVYLTRQRRTVASCPRAQTSATSLPIPAIRLSITTRRSQLPAMISLGARPNKTSCAH